MAIIIGDIDPAVLGAGFNQSSEQFGGDQLG